MEQHTKTSSVNYLNGHQISHPTIAAITLVTKDGTELSAILLGLRSQIWKGLFSDPSPIWKKLLAYTWSPQRSKTLLENYILELKSPGLHNLFSMDNLSSWVLGTNIFLVVAETWSNFLMMIYMLQNLVVLLGILLQRMTLIFTLTSVVALGSKNEKETGRTTWMGHCTLYSSFLGVTTAIFIGVSLSLV